MRWKGALLQVQEVVWLEEVAEAAKSGGLRTGALNFADRVFQNDIHMAIQETRQVCPKLLAYRDDPYVRDMAITLPPLSWGHMHRYEALQQAGLSLLQSWPPNTPQS